MPVFCGLFPSGYRSLPRTLSPPAFRSFSVSGYQPQCADYQTRTARPVQSPVNRLPAHTSSRSRGTFTSGQSADMAMMYFHSQPSGEYDETDDTGMYPVHRKTGLQAVHAANRLSLNTIFLAEAPFFPKRGNQLWCTSKQQAKGSSKLVT